MMEQTPLSPIFWNKVLGGGTPGPTPSGTISITENGTYDVAQYAEAKVQVSSGEKTLTKLAEVTITEPVSALAITASDAMKSCDKLYIRLEDVALSVEDWIYPYINNNPSINMGYLPSKATVFDVLFVLIAFETTTVGGKTLPKGFQYGPFNGVTSSYFCESSGLSAINLRAYNRNITFVGGTVEIWGYVE